MSAYKTMIRNRSEAITLITGDRHTIDDDNDPVVDDPVTVYGYIPAENTGEDDGTYTIEPVVPYSEVEDSGAEDDILYTQWLIYNERRYHIENISKIKVQGDYYYKIAAARE